jgi:hypothetical protein
MKLSRTSWILVCFFTVSIAWLLNPGVTFGYDVEKIQIQVSPNVLNIGSKGEVVTVHTDLPYNIVKGASVFLNGVPISWWKSDDRGFFVAKFDIDKVKYEAGLIVGNNTIILTGVTTTNVQFTGEQILKVVDK